MILIIIAFYIHTFAFINQVIKKTHLTVIFVKLKLFSFTSQGGRIIGSLKRLFSSFLIPHLIILYIYEKDADIKMLKNAKNIKIEFLNFFRLEIKNISNHECTPYWDLIFCFSSFIMSTLFCLTFDQITLQENYLDLAQL